MERVKVPSNWKSLHDDYRSGALIYVYPDKSEFVVKREDVLHSEKGEPDESRNEFVRG